METFLLFSEMQTLMYIIRNQISLTSSASSVPSAANVPSVGCTVNPSGLAAATTVGTVNYINLLRCEM